MHANDIFRCIHKHVHANPMQIQAQEHADNSEERKKIFYVLYRLKLTYDYSRSPYPGSYDLRCLLKLCLLSWIGVISPSPRGLHVQPDEVEWSKRQSRTITNRSNQQARHTSSSFHMTVQSNCAIAIATLSDWLKNVAPVF